MIAALRQRYWIPPWALAAGQLAHLTSWVLLFALASAHSRPLTLGFDALAWLHVAVLGWLTLTALAVLMHVIPAFTDAEWRAEGIARAAIGVYALGVAVLVWAFWNGAVRVLPWGGAVIIIGLAAYIVPAGVTLASAFRGPRREAAIARALLMTLLALAVTALIGGMLATTFSGRLAPVHGAFGIVGWLTVLVMGVSTRTVRPITGAAFRSTTTHIATGALELFGVLVFAFWMWPGAILMAAGAVIYAGDVVDVLRRATVEHRPPQAFVAAGIVWLLDGAFLGIGWLAGAPWGAAAVYVLVAGWVGQMVNAHMHHIGIRLIATIARGDDDETRPEELLSAPLSWIAFGFFQAAVAAGALALVRASPSLLGWAALAGIAGWCALAANITAAARRSARSPQTA